MFLFKSKFHLFDLFDIPINVDLSLVILLLFFVTGGGSLFQGLACALLLLVSITAHEFGHSLTARAFGYGTRDITLSLLGGCASLIALPRKASQELLTAIAGPAVSFALATGAFVAIAMLGSEGTVTNLLYCKVMGNIADKIPCIGGNAFFVTEQAHEVIFVCSQGAVEVVQFLLYLAIMNLMLGLFNMLPGFPLDGGRVFRSAMRSFMPRRKATYVAMIVGRVVAVLVGLRGLFSLFHGGNWGFVSILIAWMIWREGRREYLLACAESNWEYADYRAHVSPPPYGGKGDDCDVHRDR